MKARKFRVGQKVRAARVRPLSRIAVKRRCRHHRKPNARISASTVMDLKADAVYGWRRGSKYLYFGFTSNLLSRLSRHHIVGVVEPLQRKDVIDVWLCPSCIFDVVGKRTAGKTGRASVLRL